MAEPNFEKDAILYADCYANQIKAVKAVFDSLGHYSRWDVAQLAIRKEGWEPEFYLTDSKLKRISEQYEISIENLESIIEELNQSDQN